MAIVENECLQGMGAEPNSQMQRPITDERPFEKVSSSSKGMIFDQQI